MGLCNVLLNQVTIPWFFALSATTLKIQFPKLNLTDICIYACIFNSTVHLREVVALKLLPLSISMSFVSWQRKLKTNILQFGKVSYITSCSPLLLVLILKQSSKAKWPEYSCSNDEPYHWSLQIFISLNREKQEKCCYTENI